jgi:hypothetical protein
VGSLHNDVHAMVISHGIIFGDILFSSLSFYINERMSISTHSLTLKVEIEGRGERNKTTQIHAQWREENGWLCALIVVQV